MTHGGLVTLQIRDDGVGVDPASTTGLLQQGRFGLVSMPEWVEMVSGRLTIRSTPRQGTTIAVELGRRLARR